MSGFGWFMWGVGGLITFSCAGYESRYPLPQILCWLSATVGVDISTGLRSLACPALLSPPASPHSMLPAVTLTSWAFPYRATPIGHSSGCQEQCASHSWPTPTPLSGLSLNVLSSGKMSWSPRLGQLPRLSALVVPCHFPSRHSSVPSECVFARLSAFLSVSSPPHLPSTWQVV